MNCMECSQLQMQMDLKGILFLFPSYANMQCLLDILAFEAATHSVAS